MNKQKFKAPTEARRRLNKSLSLGKVFCFKLFENVFGNFLLKDLTNLFLSLPSQQETIGFKKLGGIRNSDWIIFEISGCRPFLYAGKEKRMGIF
nr:hypothetical protein [uncultured Draconibacterium sp.]